MVAGVGCGPRIDHDHDFSAAADGRSGARGTTVDVSFGPDMGQFAAEVHFGARPARVRTATSSPHRCDRDVTPEERIRAICLALPEVTEKLSHGAPSFFVRKQFLALWVNGHHDDDFPHLWCAAPLGAQEALVAANPNRYFRPPYVGGRGWVGVRLDGDVDWDELESVCRDAYRTVAPPKPAARLE